MSIFFWNWILTVVLCWAVSYANLNLFKQHVYLPFIKGVQRAHQYEDLTESVAMNCEVGALASDEVVPRLVQTKSSLICISRPDTHPAALKHANYMRLYAQNKKLPGLVAAYFGVYAQIVYLTSLDIVMFNPTVRVVTTNARKIYCREESVDGRTRRLDGMYAQVSIRYLDEDFVVREIEIVDSRDACVVQSLLLDLLGKKNMSSVVEQHTS